MFDEDDMSENDAEPFARNPFGETKLSAEQKRVIFETIKEYCPSNSSGVVYEDVLAQMEQMEKKGYNLPSGYNKHASSIDENEIRLYEQQIQRDKNASSKKMGHMLNFTALCMSWFCRSMDFDWIKTKKLPHVVRRGIKDGEFDECLQGMESHVRGTVVDNPVFSTVIKFLEKIGEAHSIEEDDDETKADNKSESQRTSELSSLHALRRTSPAAQTPDRKADVSSLNALPARNCDVVVDTPMPRVDRTETDERVKKSFAAPPDMCTTTPALDAAIGVMGRPLLEALQPAHQPRSVASTSLVALDVN